MTSGHESQPLAGKSALITGASGGIGSAAALLLARAGAEVILSGRDTDKLETLAAEIRFAAASEAPILTADLTDAEQVHRLVQQAAEQSSDGKLDIVVNAAGTGAIKSIDALTPHDFQTLLAVNLYGAMILSQAAFSVMAPHKEGHLLHVIGILGKAPMANATAYCASKYGLSGFLAALRSEAARRSGIKITGLYLGGVDTPFYDNPAIEMKVQRDKMLSPQDAAEAILYALTQPAHLVMGELTLQPESHQL